MNRIPDSLAERLKTNPFRRPNRYRIVQGQKVLSETLCKRCGDTLTALAPDPRMRPIRRDVKGTKEKTIVLETFVSRQRTPRFDTIEFEVEEPIAAFVPEGGETRDEEPRAIGVHRSAICTSCKHALMDGVNDLDEVQQLYDADLERMAIEDEVNKVPVTTTRKVLDQLATRKVLRVLG